MLRDEMGWDGMERGRKRTGDGVGREGDGMAKKSYRHGAYQDRLTPSDDDTEAIIRYGTCQKAGPLLN